MIIRKAVTEDTDLLLANRSEFLNAIHKSGVSEDFLIETKSYIKSHLADGSLICYIAEDKTTVASCAMLCVFDNIPTVSNKSGKTGYLYNVYTKDPYKRQGLATKVLQEIIKESEAIGIGKILLDYTIEGYPLYVKLGFKHLDKQLELILNQ